MNILPLATGMALAAHALAAGPVTVSVDPSRAGNRIPADFLGLSYETSLMRPDAADIAALFAFARAAGEKVIYL